MFTWNAYSLEYFVFGYSSFDCSRLVFGAVDTVSLEIGIDYEGTYTKGIMQDFMSGKKLCIVLLDNTYVDTYAGFLSKPYIHDKMFVLDRVSSSLYDRRGFIKLQEDEVLGIDIGRPGMQRWEDGRVYKNVKVSFYYEDMFKEVRIQRRG